MVNWLLGTSWRVPFLVMATYQKEHFEIEKDIGELAFFFQGGDVAYI